MDIFETTAIRGDFEAVAGDSFNDFGVDAILGRSEILAYKIDGRDDEAVLWVNPAETGGERAFVMRDEIIDFIGQAGID